MKKTSQEDQFKLDKQLCFPLYISSRRIINLYSPYLRPLGLTYTQYLVMLVLWDQKEVTVGDLCRTLYLEHGTVTPMLKKMETAGLLNRSRDVSDERIVRVTLTPKGSALQEDCKDLPNKISETVTLTDEQATTLRELLDIILR